MYISSNIRYLRRKRGLTQAKLAEELEKTTAAVSDYEKGKSTPPLEVAFRISRFFNITLDDLVSKDLQKEDILAREGIPPKEDSAYSSWHGQLQKQLRTQERLIRLQEQRVLELEREIREQAPELARRLGLDG